MPTHPRDQESTQQNWVYSLGAGSYWRGRSSDGKTTGGDCFRQLRELLADWEEIFILNLYKSKDEVLIRGTCFKLTDEVMKLLERVLNLYIHKTVNIDEMQFGFAPGRSASYAILFVHYGQEYYFTFVDQEKAFDRVPRKFLYMVGLGRLGVDERAVRVTQGMYANAWNHVWVNGQYSE